MTPCDDALRNHSLAAGGHLRRARPGRPGHCCCTALGANPSLAQTAYRIARVDDRRRVARAARCCRRGASPTCWASSCARRLMGWALWLQYGLGLEPCPLCVFQRVAVIAIGVVFLVAAIHNPGASARSFYAVLTLRRRRRRRRARRVARLDPGAAEGRGRRVRHGPRLHARDAAVHRRHRPRARRAAANAPRRAGCSSASRSRRGRSCSSSR